LDAFFKKLPEALTRETGAPTLLLYPVVFVV